MVPCEKVSNTPRSVLKAWRHELLVLGIVMKTTNVNHLDLRGLERNFNVHDYVPPYCNIVLSLPTVFPLPGRKIPERRDWNEAQEING